MTLRPLTIAALMLLWATATRLHADDAAYTVLPATQVVHLARLCSRSEPGLVSEGWQPTVKQILQAEALLPAFVSANRRPQEPLGGHHRQYLGVVIGGKRLIYINVFPRWLVERRELAGLVSYDWLTAFVDVCDGGDGFWGALYDPEIQRFFSPQFNGSMGPPNGPFERSGFAGRSTPLC
jgi:hypothetical protein